MRKMMAVKHTKKSDFSNSQNMHDILPFNLFIRMSRRDIKSFIEPTASTDGCYFSFQVFHATTFTSWIDEGDETSVILSLLDPLNAF